MSNLLEDLDVLVTDAQWLRSAHAWRVLCELPEGVAIAPAIAAMIEQKVDVQLRGELTVDIYPAHIVTVKHSKKKFTAIFETCQESQNILGPKLVGMINTRALLTLTKAGTPKGEPVVKDFLKGLHVLFGNPRFQEFIQYEIRQQGVTVEIRDAKTAKSAFKHLVKIESTKELTRDDYNFWTGNFTAWLKGRGN